MAQSPAIKDLLIQVKQAATTLTEQIYNLDDQIEALYAKRSKIISAPLSKADYMAAIRSDIQAKGRLFGNSLGRHVDVANNVTYPTLDAAMIGGLPHCYLSAGIVYGDDMGRGAYYFYFEDIIMQGIERALAGKQWPIDAVPAIDRAMDLLNIAGELVTLTNARDALADELVAAGLTG